MMQDDEKEPESAPQMIFSAPDPTTGLPITQEQLIASQTRMTSILMATRYPVSLHATLATSPSLYSQEFFRSWVPRIASSPPSPFDPTRVSPVPNTKPSSRRNNRKRNNNNNNNNNNNDRIVRRGRADTSRVSPSTSPETTRNKRFVCGVCNTPFGYKHVLQNHARIHTGEKPFQCKECKKRFTRDHHLKTHIRLHTGEKPYKCTYCDRKFVQVANLRRHERIHTGDRPYACNSPGCSSKFSDSNQLKAHKLIHKNEKSFECENYGGTQESSPDVESTASLYSDSHDSEENADGDGDAHVNGEQTMEEEPEEITTRRFITLRSLAGLPINPELNGPVYPSMTLSPPETSIDLPEQTEPEDLSMNKSS
ncbi:hypothetical protein P5V15_011855 [Pogonomyrmex californicus]